MNRKKYIGRANLKIDAKGRVAVPAFCRVNGSKSFYVTVGRKKCLLVFDEATFQERISELEALDAFDERTDEIVRAFTCGASLEVDSHGRLTIPKELRAFANLSSDVVFVGLLTHLEIWDGPSFEAEHAANIANLSKNMQEIAAERRDKR